MYPKVNRMKVRADEGSERVMRKETGLLALAAAFVLAGCNGAVSDAGRRWLETADAAYRRGDDAEAIRAAGEFLELHPRIQESGEALYIRGLALRRGGDTEAARADLEAAAELTRRPDLLARIHLALGEIAFQDARMPAAESHYRQVLELTPAAAPPADQALYRLGAALQWQGKWSEADYYFTRLRHFFDGTELARRAGDRIRARQWSIQAGAFAKSEPALRQRRRLSRAGLPARIDTDLRDGRLLRLVRVGAWPDYSAARARLAEVRAVVPGAYATVAR
jgi:tetratricopeptide (TPR) repeat protein